MSTSRTVSRVPVASGFVAVAAIIGSDAGIFGLVQKMVISPV